VELPTYEYRCASCQHHFERFQKMSDEPVRECEVCGCEVQRVLFPVAIHFKGSGFYTTDYGRKKALKAGAGNGNGASASEGSDTGDKSTAKAASESDA
jgi:putative FmdB family regulatory protein